MTIREHYRIHIDAHRKSRLNLLFPGLVLFGARTMAVAAPQEYFAIHIVDDKTGRGVPLVRLQTTSKIRYITDSNGYVAFLEPGIDGSRSVLRYFKLGI